MPESLERTVERDDRDAPMRTGDKVCLDDIWYKVHRITKKDVILRTLKTWELTSDQFK